MSENTMIDTIHDVDDLADEALDRGEGGKYSQNVCSSAARLH